MALTNTEAYPKANPDWLRFGSPAIYAESVPKILASVDCAIAATGVELVFDMYFDAGVTVTALNFVTGGTAAGTPTNGYVVLRDSTGAKLAQSADFTTTARAANTAYAGTLATAYTTPSAGLYRVGISFTATTVPTLRGVSMLNAALAAAGRACTQTHGSGVLGVAPATVATPTSAFVIPYVYAT